MALSILPASCGVTKKTAESGSPILGPWGFMRGNLLIMLWMSCEALSASSRESANAFDHEPASRHCARETCPCCAARLELALLLSLCADVWPILRDSASYHRVEAVSSLYGCGQCWNDDRGAHRRIILRRKATSLGMTPCLWSHSRFYSVPVLDIRAEGHERV
jgi:hypothetical protein